MTQAQDQHKWFGIDASQGDQMSGECIERRFKALIDGHVTLNIFLGSCPLEIPVQVLRWGVVDGVVQWQFKPKHGEGFVWIDSTSDEYSVIS